MIGCDDEGEGADRLEVEEIGENEEGEATAVAIARMGIGVMTWRVLLLQQEKERKMGNESVCV